MRNGLVALTMVVTAAVADPAAAKGAYRAERFDVRAAVELDRSLTVTETTVFRFEGEPITFVWRDLPTDRIDGVVRVMGLMDGRAFAEGVGPGRLEIERGRRVRVTWHFAPTTGRHTFVLTYRLLGVVSQGADRDLFAWYALPRGHTYVIDNASIDVTWPDGVTPLSAGNVRLVAGGDKRERRVPMPPPAVEAGPSGLRLSATAVPRHRSIRLDVPFPVGAFASAMPEWQAREARATARGPWLLLVAALLVVVWGLWVARLRQQYRPHDRVFAGAGPLTKPPDDLPVAAAASLLSGGRVSGGYLLATILDLAGRGALTIEQDEAPRLGGRRFTAHRQPATGLAQHERAVLDAAFGAAETSAPFAKAAGRIARSRPARAAVTAELEYRGLLDPERVDARRALTVAALVALAAAGLLALVAGLVLQPAFGAWVWVLPATAGVVAAASGIMAGSLSLLTEEGHRRQQAWKAFFDHLKQVAKGKAAGAEQAARSYLAFAAAIGVAAPLAKMAAKGGAPGVLPAWFRAAGTGDADAAFVAMLASGSHTGGAAGGAGGAGGGGAAGGGGSGAG